MKYITDFHIHSRYARACSKDLTLNNIAEWCAKKGIDIVGTGDFTHPRWFAELQENLVESEPGLYKLKNSELSTRFLCTTELASIYKQGDKVRRVHNLIFAPSLQTVAKLIKALEDRGVNLKSDGRPIMGIHCDELVKIIKDVDESMELVPAHVWTPHFGVFGSLSGFDSLYEAFGDMTQYIFAVETGLSSNPKMNWQIPELDNIALISNSDAHSLRKLGREANILEVDPTRFSYQEIIRIIKGKNNNEFLSTIEFYPEEGKYHLDGHRTHLASFWPKQTKKYNGICPECGKKILRGVMSRVEDLANAPATKNKAIPANLPAAKNKVIPDATSAREGVPGSTHRIPFKSIIPLEEIIVETLGVGTASKKVQTEYETLVSQVPEFKILLDLSMEELTNLAGAQLAQSVKRVREGKVTIEPGYDGVFGKISIYSQEEREQMSLKPKQSKLF